MLRVIIRSLGYSEPHQHDRYLDHLRRQVEDVYEKIAKLSRVIDSNCGRTYLDD